MGKRKIKNILYGLLMFFAIYILIISCGTNIGICNALSKNDTNNSVITDLLKDSKFALYNYPKREFDNSLEVINVAETNNGELIIYVYQPSCRYLATSINISKEIDKDIQFFNYKLEFIDKYETLFKYKVKTFNIDKNDTRYYSISSIFRCFDELVDIEPDNDNVVTEVAYPVNKQYCFYEENGRYKNSVVETESIVVTNKFVGLIHYSDGFKLFPTTCDSHFVAFNTDKPIDNLLEADVYYTSSDTDISGDTSSADIPPKVSFGNIENHVVRLKYTDKVEHQGDGLFAPTYKWNRISTVEDFINNENVDHIKTGAIINIKTANKITDKGLKELRDNKWVLRFLETKSEYVQDYYKYDMQSTTVGDVTILRLKFKTDGIVYNLGVIDNKQSGSTNGINEQVNDIFLSNKVKEYIYIGIFVLLLIVLFILLYPLYPYIFKSMGNAIKKLFGFFKKHIKNDK